MDESSDLTQKVIYSLHHAVEQMYANVVMFWNDEYGCCISCKRHFGDENGPHAKDCPAAKVDEWRDYSSEVYRKYGNGSDA